MFCQFEDGELDDQDWQAFWVCAIRFNFNNYAKALKATTKDLRSSSPESMSDGAKKIPCSHQTIPGIAAINYTIST